MNMIEIVALIFALVSFGVLFYFVFGRICILLCLILIGYDIEHKLTPSRLDTLTAIFTLSLVLIYLFI
jgi:hypothetical protein